MTAYDLILYVLDGEDGKEQATIELINEMAQDLLSENEDCSWGQGLLREIEEFALKRGRCPECGSRLIYKSVQGDQCEYFGLPVNEETTEATCLECGFIYE